MRLEHTIMQIKINYKYCKTIECNTINYKESLKKYNTQ